MITACCVKACVAPSRRRASTSWARPSDGDEAVRLVPAAKPDVILMDVSMPDMDGIEATRRILQNDPDKRIVMLTMHADKDLIDAAIKAGAVGYLTKDCSTDEVIEAVRMAANGETALSPQLAKTMLSEVRKIDEKAGARRTGSSPSARKRCCSSSPTAAPRPRWRRSCTSARRR